MKFLMDNLSLENLKKHPTIKYTKIIDNMSCNQYGVWSILDDSYSLPPERQQSTISKKLNDSMLDRIFDK